MDARGAGRPPPRKNGSTFALTATRAAAYEKATDEANGSASLTSLNTPGVSCGVSMDDVKSDDQMSFLEMLRAGPSTSSPAPEPSNTSSHNRQSLHGAACQVSGSRTSDRVSAKHRTNANLRSPSGQSVAFESEKSGRSTPHGFQKFRENTDGYRRYFFSLFCSIMRFSGLLMVTWEITMTGCHSILANGGPAALLYGYVYSFFGSWCIAAILAELTSIMPVAGGQLMWTWMFAPVKTRKFLSYIAGHIGFWGNQAMVAGLVCVISQLIASVAFTFKVSLFDADWAHVMIIYVPILILAGSMLRFGEKYVPYFELFAHGCHLFTVVLVPTALCLLGRSLAPEVETQVLWGTIGAYQDHWESAPLAAASIGLIGVNFAFLRVDGPCYKSVEVEGGKTVAPAAIIFTHVVEGIMGFAQILAFIYYAGPWIEIVTHPSITPFHFSLFHWTHSRFLVLFTTMPMLIHLFEAVCAALQNAVSQLQGLALQDAFFGGPATNHKFRKPNQQGILTHNYYICTVIACIFTLVRFVAMPCYQAFWSLAIITHQIGYLIPIILYVYARITGKVEHGPFRMPNWLAFPVYAIGIFYAIWTIFFAGFAVKPVITKCTFPWGPFIFGILLLLSVIYYCAMGRLLYDGPKEDLEYFHTEQDLATFKKYNPHPRQVGMRSDGKGGLGKPIMVKGYQVPTDAASITDEPIRPCRSIFG